jgi:hypothetical protein
MLTLFQPSLVPGDLIVYIEIGGIIFVLVCKSVRDVRESIEVRLYAPPVQ